MGMWPVSDAKEKDLLRRMAQLAVTEASLQEEFVRGGGPGGQKINKTSVAVILRHRPSNLTVRCQESRSQAMNRFLARRLLVERLAEKISGEKSARRKAIEKLRRQKRRRSRRAKEKMLTAKHHQATKKQLRRRPPLTHEDD